MKTNLLLQIAVASTLILSCSSITLVDDEITSRSSDTLTSHELSATTAINGILAMKTQPPISNKEFKDLSQSLRDNVDLSSTPSSLITVINSSLSSQSEFSSKNVNDDLVQYIVSSIVDCQADLSDLDGYGKDNIKSESVDNNINEPVDDHGDKSTIDQIRRKPNSKINRGQLSKLLKRVASGDVDKLKNAYKKNCLKNGNGWGHGTRHDSSTPTTSEVPERRQRNGVESNADRKMLAALTQKDSGFVKSPGGTALIVIVVLFTVAIISFLFYRKYKGKLPSFFYKFRYSTAQTQKKDQSSTIQQQVLSSIGGPSKQTTEQTLTSTVSIVPSVKAAFKNAGPINLESKDYN